MVKAFFSLKYNQILHAEIVGDFPCLSHVRLCYLARARESWLLVQDLGRLRFIVNIELGNGLSLTNNILPENVGI